MLPIGYGSKKYWKRTFYFAVNFLIFAEISIRIRQQQIATGAKLEITCINNYSPAVGSNFYVFVNISMFAVITIIEFNMNYSILNSMVYGGYLNEIDLKLND